MVEIPPKFSDMSPVNPDDSIGRTSEFWKRAEGMAADVQYYGNCMKREAFKKIGHLYPKVKVPKNQGGGEATVIAWIWTRTVRCPNPVCGCEMPLASSFILSKKKGNVAYINPLLDQEKKKIDYEVRYNGKAPQPGKLARGAKFKCLMCGESTTDDYIKNEAVSGRMGVELMAVVAEGKKGRIYITPDQEQRLSADIPKPDNLPEGAIGGDRRALWTPLYGLTEFSDLFTNRQLTTLTTFCDLVPHLQKKIENDAINVGMADDHISLKDGGVGARAYAEAISVYLAFAIDKVSDRGSTGCGWDTQRDGVTNTFGRQAIPMKWDYAESNPFSNSSGCFSNAVMWEVKCLQKMPAGKCGFAEQANAQEETSISDVMISTDPPYYDNIGYADLSDYFYIWMRRSLRDTFPRIFSTMLVPKSEELIATPHRHEGSMEKAKNFFEDGMLATCRQIYKSTTNSIPVTIYYAYKQSDTDGNNERASSGWETMLTSIIKAGFAITGTWPMRTELTSALKHGVNALATSIVLVCRKRNMDAGQTTRRNFINELKRELRPALQKLQQSNIAPVDMAQSAIGPGMAVFSKYKQVLEADGTPMTVRCALQIINQELDLYFNEQDSDLDTESRFCVDLYSQSAFNEIPFGDANTLATAKNTSVATMASHGILYAQKGKVHLVDRPDLPAKISEYDGSIWLLCQQLTYMMEKDGIEGCAETIVNMFGSNPERAKDLAYRLYTIAERKKWAQEAYAYNALVVAWPEIQSRAAELKAVEPVQMTLDSYLKSKN